MLNPNLISGYKIVIGFVLLSVCAVMMTAGIVIRENDKASSDPRYKTMSGGSRVEVLEVEGGTLYKSNEGLVFVPDPSSNCPR
jgi:hypothetical protein